MSDLYDLKQYAEETFLQAVENGQDPDEALFEAADSAVPAYNSDRAEILAEHPSIGYREIDYASWDDDLWTRLGYAIFEEIRDHLHEAAQREGIEL